jgi:hypothetical protein
MRRLMFSLPALLALLVLAGASFTRSARAFELPIHERIVIEALNGQVSGEAFNIIIHGNKESDIHQMAPERHFDSAQSPADICDEWGKGFQRFMTEAVKLAKPAGDWQDALDDREGALSAFGAASHTVQDFYSHSNWIEHFVGDGSDWNGVLPPVAPLIGAGCDPGAFPPDLNSGYASVIWFAAQFGHSWCGPLGQPEGFEHCHDDLAKDDPEKDHGGQEIANGVTYHEVAVKLATATTRAAWDELHRRIINSYDNAETDGECVFRKLAWGGDESCRRSFRLTGPFESDVVWTGAVTSTQHYRGTLDVSFRTLPDGTIAGTGTAALSFDETSTAGPSQCTGLGSGNVPVTVKGEWTRTDPTGRRLKLTFVSDEVFNETRTCVTPERTITFDIDGNMVYPNAGLGIAAKADAADKLNDDFVTDTSVLHGEMHHRWGTLTLKLPGNG